jgi:tetratricopeptide (TPR) repeat protein
MIHCRTLALSEIANDDQRFIANLRVCQVAKVGPNVDVREGLAHCWKAVELQPDAGEAYRARGLALTRSDRFKQSLQDLTKAIKLGEGDDPKIYSARSFVRSALEDYSGGIADAVTARRKYADKGETPPASLFALQSHMHFSADQFSDARAAIAAGREIKADYPAF